MRVLVVEDSSSVRRLLRRTVESLGHPCEEAEDGAAAWASLDERAVDVIISDWMMPRMSGLELCQRLRERAGLPYVYFAFVTGLGDQEHALEGVRSGADDYLVKPVRISDVERCLLAAGRVVALHRRREAVLAAAKRLAVETDAEGALRILLDRALRAPGVVSATVFRWDEAAGGLSPVVGSDEGGGALAARFAAEEAVAERRTSVAGSFELADDGSGRTAIAVPLIAEDRVLGALHVVLARWRDEVPADEVGTFELLAGLAAATLAGVERSRSAAAESAVRELARLVGADLAEARAALARADGAGGGGEAARSALATARRCMARAARRLGGADAEPAAADVA